MPLKLRHLVIGTVGAMNKHKMTLVNNDARGGKWSCIECNPVAHEMVEKMIGEGGRGGGEGRVLCDNLGRENCVRFWWM